MILNGTLPNIESIVDSELTKLAGISYYDIDVAMAKNGNTPGCHQPLLYVISRLVAENKIKSIVEFGSGATTVLFQALSQKYNIKLLTLENSLEWYNNTLQICQDANVPTTNIVLSDFQDIKLNFKADLIFSDSCPSPTRIDLVQQLIDKKKTHKKTIFMWDDCQHEIAFNKTLELAKTNNFNKPKLFLSETRGIAVIDPLNLINFVQYKIY